MKQNTREEFAKVLQQAFDDHGEKYEIHYPEKFGEDIFNFFLSHHNRTLKELEEECGKERYELGDGEYVKLDDIKQLIHQKLIK